MWLLISRTPLLSLVILQHVYYIHMLTESTTLPLRSRLDHTLDHIHISTQRYRTSKEDRPLLVNMTSALFVATDYPFDLFYWDVIPQRTAVAMGNSGPTYSEVLHEPIDGPYGNADTDDLTAPARDHDWHEARYEISSYGRSRRVSIGSVESEDRYGRLNAFIPSDGVTYVSTGSNSPTTTPALSQESVCYIRNCERCTSDHPAHSPRGSGSWPAADRNFNPDRLDLTENPMLVQYDGTNQGASSLPQSRRRHGPMRFCEPGRSNLRSRFFHSATRRLSSLLPNKPTPELTPLDQTGAARPPPTGKPSFFERLASLGRSRR